MPLPSQNSLQYRQSIYQKQGFQKAATTDETRRLHCSEKSATFFSEEEATGLNSAMDKNIIFSRGIVCYLVKLSLFIAWSS